MTGGAQGVGLAFGEALLDRGCAVVLVDRQPEVLEVADGLGDRGPGRRRRPGRSGLARRRSRRPPTGLEIGLAVANAAVSYVGPLPRADARRAGPPPCRSTASRPPSWPRGPCRRWWRGVEGRSSSRARARRWPAPGAVATYSASKAYVLNLAEAIGWELRDTGVVCQAVVAPAMDTPGWRSHPVDEARMLQPAADPGRWSRRALDHLAAGGRFLADPGPRGRGRHRAGRTGRAPVERHELALPRRVLGRLVEIRDAEPSDLSQVLEIQNALLASTTIEWRDEPYTLDAVVAGSRSTGRRAIRSSSPSTATRCSGSPPTATSVTPSGGPATGSRSSTPCTCARTSGGAGSAGRSSRRSSSGHGGRQARGRRRGRREQRRIDPLPRATRASCRWVGSPTGLQAWTGGSTSCCSSGRSRPTAARHDAVAFLRRRVAAHRLGGGCGLDRIARRRPRWLGCSRGGCPARDESVS